MVTRKSAPFALPKDDLRLFYLTAGIELKFTEGDELTFDPSDEPIDDYASVVSEYRKTSKISGHFIMGIHPPSFHPEVAGQLLDPDKRGVSVVYTDSGYVRRVGAGGVLQACAHELGHMFNLAHADVGPEFISTMDQAKTRTSSIDDSWTRAELEVKKLASEGKNPYYFIPPRQLNCYPFAFKARLALNTLSDAQLKPWGGVFEHSFDDINNE